MAEALAHGSPKNVSDLQALGIAEAALSVFPRLTVLRSPHPRQAALTLD